MLDLLNMCKRCVSIPVIDKLVHAFPFDLQWIAPVDDLNQRCASSKPDLVIIFFHGIGLGKNNEWKETWASITSMASVYIGHKSGCQQTWPVKMVTMFGFFLYHMILLFLVRMRM